HRTTGQGFSCLKYFSMCMRPYFPADDMKSPIEFRSWTIARSIGAEIEPAVFRVTRHGDARRADEPPAVQLVDFGNGELQEVYFVASHLIFEDRAVLDDARRYGLKHVELFFKAADEL